MSVLAKLRAAGALPPQQEAPADFPVRDLERIVALPKREPVDCELRERRYSPKAQALIEVMTERFSLGPRPNCKCKEIGYPCITTLNAMQAWALREMPKIGGGIAMADVGSGKTLISILMPLAFSDCREAVIFIEPGQKQQYRLTYLRLREHFRVPSIRFHDENINIDGSIVVGAPVLRVVTYARLSRGGATDLLGDKIQPDLVLCDEAHRVSHRSSTQTTRLTKYLGEYDTTRFCAWSGTLVKKSIRDQAHLLGHALGYGSPMPTDDDEVEAWAMTFDPSTRPDVVTTVARRLYLTFAGREPPDNPVFHGVAQKRLREGYQKRLVSTPGIISTKGSSIGASLYFRERSAPKIPANVHEALTEVRNKWVRPDGEELVEKVEQFRCASEIAAGFYYKWVYPHGEPAEQILRWFYARKAWNKELRDKLKSAEVHMDSPMLCYNAAKRAWSDPPYVGELPIWRSETWPTWSDIKDSVYHESKAVWLDEFLAADAAEWAKTHRGVVWYLSDTFGRKIAELAGLPCHGGGPDSEAKLLSEKGDRSVVCSIKAHGSGRDGLQRLFNEQLFAQIPSGGAVIQQVAGRLHRPGQEADEVITYVYQHVAENVEALHKAKRDAEFIEATTGNRQKLNMADFEFAI